MSNDQPSPPTTSETPTHIPWDGPKGWGAAAFIVCLALALVFSAYTIHKKTFKPWRDPTNVGGDTPKPTSVAIPQQ
jgi:hypothetical protein